MAYDDASLAASALQLSEYARFGVLSEAFGWCWCRAWRVVDCSSQVTVARAIRGLSPALPGLGRRGTQEGCSQQQSTTPAAAAPVRQSVSSSPALLSPPQRVEGMATELDNRCPICLDSWEEASYAMPCCHRFCFTCIRRWADSKPECPLCKRRVSSIVHSVRAYDDFEEYVVRPPRASSVAVHQAAHSPAASPPRAAGHVPGAPVGRLQAYTWATLFWDHPALLEPLLPWLHQELGLIFEDDHLQAAIVEDIIMSSLVLSGTDEDVLVRLLGLFLHDRTVTFVNELIDAVTRLCSGEARRLLGLEDAHAARGWEGSPVAALSPTASPGGSPTPSPAPSSSPDRYSVDELPSISTAALRGEPGSPSSAPNPILGEQEQPQEEPEEQASGPSTSRQGGQLSPEGPRRPPKRRASSPEASSPPNKRPPHRQH